MNLSETYKGLLGRDPSKQEIENLNRIAKACGFKGNDAIWTLFIAQEYYQSLYKEAPARIMHAVEGAIAAVKEGSDAHVQEATSKAHTALAEAVSKSAKAVAYKSAGRDYAKWLTGAICAAVITLSAVGGGAYYLGHHTATLAVEDRATWAETEEGKACFNLSKFTKILGLARCDIKNYKIYLTDEGKKACAPSSSYGWLIP